MELPWAVPVCWVAPPPFTAQGQHTADDTSYEEWGLLPGHQRGPTPGHWWGLFHGHGQVEWPTRTKSPGGRTARTHAAAVSAMPPTVGSHDSGRREPNPGRSSR